MFTLQTLPAVEEDDRNAQVAKEAGFSLHAGVAAQAWERDKLERLCCYISRPAVSELDFIAKLASLVPKPRVNLTRFHGVFVGVPHHPNSKHRILVTPARRGKGGQKVSGQDKTPDERRTVMTWAHQK